MSKTALVTGASGGIGAAVCRRLAQDGYNLILQYHTAGQDAEALARALAVQGVNAIAVQADISDENAVENLFATGEAQCGSVDLLVNNAGVALQKLFDLTTPQEFDQLFGVNVRGTYLCSRRALPGMLKKHAGGIVNISSIWGITGASCEVVYSASKAAVIGMTKALAKEVGPSGIRVNCIAPGVIDTKMNRNLSSADMEALAQETPLGRIGTPADVAELVAFLASEKASFLTGQIIAADGGMVI